MSSNPRREEKIEEKIGANERVTNMLQVNPARVANQLFPELVQSIMAPALKDFVGRNPGFNDIPEVEIENLATGGNLHIDDKTKTSIKEYLEITYKAWEEINAKLLLISLEELTDRARSSAHGLLKQGHFDQAYELARTYLPDSEIVLYAEQGLRKLIYEMEHGDFSDESYGVLGSHRFPEARRDSVIMASALRVYSQKTKLDDLGPRFWKLSLLVTSDPGRYSDVSKVNELKKFRAEARIKLLGMKAQNDARTQNIGLLFDKLGLIDFEGEDQDLFEML